MDSNKLMKNGKKAGKGLGMEQSLSLCCFMLLLIAWCVLTFGGMVSDIFLPSPLQVIQRLIEMHQDGSLWLSCLEST